MANQTSFMIGDVHILIEEGDFDGDGFQDLKFTVTVDETGGQTADLRGLFWDVSDESRLAGMEVWAPGSTDVTDAQFEADGVDDLGNGANMKGAVKGNEKFDAGVEIGTQGASPDDIQTTSFVIRSPGTDLSLIDIDGMRFGVRLTSVGEIDGAREDSLKLLGVAPENTPPEANNEHVVTDEDTATAINILSNDSDPDGDMLKLVGIRQPGGLDPVPIGVGVWITSNGGRDAWVTVNADGTVSVDPSGNFEDLTTGDTDSFRLDYIISDCRGGEDGAWLKVQIKGVNDAPVAVDDVVYVESADSVLADVLANDSDVDGTLDGTTLAVAGATNGIAAAVAGQLSYAAFDIGGDTTDDSVADDLTYTVDDNEGLTSNTANVQVRVIDPLVESDTDSSAAGNGQVLSLSLATEDRTYNDSSFVDVDIAAGSVSQNVNVSFVIDGSGSITFGEFAEQRQAVQNTIDQLRLDYMDSVATVTVQIVQFAGNQAPSGIFDLYSTTLDDISTGTALASQITGNTPYNLGLQAAVNFFNGKAGQDNFLLFTSDGEPNPAGAYLTRVAELDAIGVSRTAVGFNAADLGVLNTIDNTGGAEIVPNAAALGDAFADSPLFPADLLSFELKVDDVLVADLGDLSGGGNAYSLDDVLSGLSAAGTLGAKNHVTALAGFDTDNDGAVDEFRFAETWIDGTDGSDIVFA